LLYSSLLDGLLIVIMMSFIYTPVFFKLGTTEGWV